MKKKNPYKRKRPMARTLEVIGKEYAELAQKTGHIAYQISVMQDEIEKAQDAMRALNVEASKLQAKTEGANEQAEASGN